MTFDPDDNTSEEKNGYKTAILTCLVISVCITSSLAAVAIYLAWMRLNGIP